MPELPDSATYVVVGGGVHGLSAAYHLAEELGSGDEVVVLEKRRVGAGASGVCGGIVRNFYVSPAVNEIVRQSVEIFELDRSGFGYHPVGYVAAVPELQEADVERIAWQHEQIGYESELVLGAGGAREHMRAIFPDWRANGVTALLHEKQGGWADATATVANLAGMGRSLGVRIVEGAEVLGFTIEPGTAEAIRRNAGLAQALSGERIQQEIVKILRGPVPSVGFRMLSNLGLLDVICPELEKARETPQEKVAAENVFEHSLATLDAAADEMPPGTAADEDLALRLAALFHDIGKPDTFDDGHFHQHEFVGEAKVRNILRRWKLDKATTEEVAHLIRHHMFWYQPDWTGSAVRRFIRKVGLERIPVLFALRKADNVGSGARAPRMYALNELWLRVQEEIHSATAFSKRDLTVDGNDIMRELGIPPGPEVGRIQDELFERVLDEPALNEPERLIALAREIHSRRPR